VIPIGAEDIPPEVDILAFREIIRRRGYTVKWEHCPTPNCGHSAEAKVHLLEFGELDETLPTSETF
jgi:hypothetical protein